MDTYLPNYIAPQPTGPYLNIQCHDHLKVIANGCLHINDKLSTADFHTCVHKCAERLDVTEMLHKCAHPSGSVSPCDYRYFS
jgi:hypothetical protein